MSKHSFFVSDLHLFSRRSQAEKHLPSMQQYAASAHTFVLGGDIFDFRWTTLSSISATIDAAIHWLDQFVSEHPECQFHFVLGNHDSNRNFVRKLSILSARVENLAWHPYYLRVDDSLFLHGDVADGPRDERALARKRDRWHHERKRGPVFNAMYDMVIQARLHKAVSNAVHREQFVLRRVHRYLCNVGQGPESGLRHVYFGHTHAAMSDVEYGGLTFHNGGAPIAGLQFRVLETGLAQPALVRMAG
jgi:UDP-2,3-diacylglucosamine pyrophosphatase LpxH